MRRLAWLSWAVGAVVCLAAPFLPDPDTSDHAAMAVFGLVLAAGALLIAVLPPRFAVLRAAPFLGVLFISGVIAVARPIGATPFFFLWPVLYGAYFLSRRHLAVLLGVVAVAYAVALSQSPAGARVILFFGSYTSVAVAGLLVMVLKERADRLVEELHRTATTDALTDLPNRRAFEAALARELGRGRRSGGPMTLALFDLDYFKQVNDRLGHAAGDRALVRFADVLRAQGRGGDVSARLGGEEFAVLLLDADVGAAQSYAERVARAVTEATAHSEAPLTFSAGLAGVAGGLATPDALLGAADKALYAAKAAGRRRVVVFGAGLGTALP
jgi:diguanylate cyclase (GGDEF)-like protein